MRFYTKYIVGILLVATGFITGELLGQEPIDVSNTHEILITSVRKSERFSKSQKGDEALIIRDRSEVAKFVSLFDKNIQHKVHACGYHWRFTFYRDGGAQTNIYFNEDCEEFDRDTDAICALVQARFGQTVRRPNAYITHLEIDVTVDPKIASANLISLGKLRLLDLDPIDRLPYVEIRASSKSVIPRDRSLWETESTKAVQNADTILNENIARVRERYNIFKVGRVQQGMISVGENEIVERERRVKIYFDIGTDLSNIESVLSGAHVGETVVPVSYRVQVLTERRLNSRNIKKLKKDFPFVRGATSYTT